MMDDRPEYIGETEWALHQSKEALHGVDEDDLTQEEIYILRGCFWTIRKLRDDVRGRNRNGND